MMCSLQTSIVVTRCIFVIELIAVLNVPVKCVNFVEYDTGFNPTLKSYELFSTFTSSRISCGSICEKMSCTSFTFLLSNNECTLYSMFMKNNDGVRQGLYYVRSDAEEHIIYHNFVCYYWSDADREALWPDYSYENEKQQCESHTGFVYTSGNTENYPNCGCWCCQPGSP